MPITETARHDMLIALERAIGKEAAMTMAEHLPSMGWADVATKHDLSAVRLDVEGVRHDVVTVRREVGSLRSDFGVMRIDLDAMRHDLDAMRHDLTGVRHDVDALRVDVDVIRRDLGTVRRDVDALRHDLVLVESRLEASFERKLGDTQRVLFFAVLGAFVANTGVVLGVLSAFRP